MRGRGRGAPAGEQAGRGGSEGAGERGWREAGRRLSQQRDGLGRRGSRHMWEIGDWLVAGEDQIFRRMKRMKVREVAVSITGYSMRTLKLAVSVARRIDPETRVESLTWWHHLLVAWLDRPRQVRWLTRAEEEGWSAEQLRQQLRIAGLIAGPRTRLRTERLIAEVIKLDREEVTDDMAVEITRWGREIFAQGA